MISTDAQNILSSILTQSLRESLYKNGSLDEWNTEMIGSIDKVEEKEFFMLTIASYSFRIFAILKFSKTPATIDYVARALKLDRSALTDGNFYDYLGEMGNIFCGAIKRELGKSYPHLGMSTPNRMHANSLDCIDTMQYDFFTHARIYLNDSIEFMGSLCIFTADDQEFKLAKPKSGQVGDKNGELVLF